MSDLFPMRRRGFRWLVCKLVGHKRFMFWPPRPMADRLRYPYCPRCGINFIDFPSPRV